MAQSAPCVYPACTQCECSVGTVPRQQSWGPDRAPCSSLSHAKACDLFCRADHPGGDSRGTQGQSWVASVRLRRSCCPWASRLYMPRYPRWGSRHRRHVSTAPKDTSPAACLRLIASLMPSNSISPACALTHTSPACRPAWELYTFRAVSKTPKSRTCVRTKYASYTYHKYPNQPCEYHI